MSKSLINSVRASTQQTWATDEPLMYKWYLINTKITY